MSMPFNTNLGKLGLIEVFEDDTHFLVRIHPENRERARRIVGRQWDGHRKAWVYPKNPTTYEALVEEFQNDADSFNIRRPTTRRPPGIQPPVKELDKDDFEDQLFEDIRSIGNIGESQEKMFGELEQIREMLGSLRDVAANQSRVLEDLRGTQEETTKVLIKFEPPTQQKIKAETVEVLPDSLDLARQREVELFEKAIVMVACCTAREQRSFCEWVSQYKPLREPSGFVTRTHEFLKKQLARLVGDENPRITFHALILKARNGSLIYRDENHPADRPISILFTLNEHRNCFGHPDFDQWEEWNRSILYLMNLALVWSKVVIEAENSDG
jgi:hypothetical protein